MKKSLSSQLLSGFSLAIVLVGTLTLVINYRLLQNDLDKQVKSNGQAIARSLEFATEGLLEYGNTSILQRMVQNYATLPKIVDIDIVAPDGKSLVLNKSVKPSNPSTNKHKFSGISSELDNAFIQAATSGLEIVIQTKIKNKQAFVHILPFSSKLFDNGNQYFNQRGLAIVAIDLEQVRNEAWAIFVTTTITMFIGILAILFLMLTLIHKYAIQPLKSLHTEIVNSQALDNIKLPKMLPDNEIAFLANTLVAAIAQLRAVESQKNAELSKINKELSDLSQFLEQKVIERTAELTATNLELQQAKELAQESSKAKSLFLANMSHELRTPLNAILGFAQLILEDDQIPTETKEQINIISQSGQNLLNMINSILVITKMEPGRQKLDIKQFYIRDLIKGVQEVIAFKVRQKQLFFKLENQANINSLIETDELKLKQILVNILDNALKFTDTGGVTLRISSETILPDHLQESQYIPLYFEVEDTGIGISESDLEFIFDPLFQADLGNRFYEGTGLGLPLSKHLIHLMGGDISASSSLHRGSLFRFNILVKLVQDVPDDNPIKNLSLDDNQIIPDSSIFNPNLMGFLVNDAAKINPNLDILLAEDNQVNQIIVLRMLQKLGYKADVAKDGLEVLAKLENHIYDVILMDIQMPHMDGLEATKMIAHNYWHQGDRQQPSTVNNFNNTQDGYPYVKPLVIALTANAFAETKDDCLAIGMYDYMTKPVAIDTLREVLQKASIQLFT